MNSDPTSQALVISSSDLAPVEPRNDPNVKVIRATQALDPGYYWKAQKDFSYAKDGDAILLIDVIDFEETPHTVTLNRHPRYGTGTFQLLVGEFLDAFIPCHDADEIRQREQQEVMQHMNDLQTELFTTQSSQQLLNEAVRERVEAELRQAEANRLHDERNAAGKREIISKNLAKTHRRAARRSEAKGNPLVAPKIAMAADVGRMIDAGINEEGVKQLKTMADTQAIIAKAQAGWLTEKTKAIAACLESLGPYLMEKSAVSQAKLSAAQKMASSISAGVASLDLYTGKDIEVFDIRTGDAAPADVKLTLVQGKRYAEEELAAWADVLSNFDYRNEQQFFDALRSNQSLVDQILPTSRCVVSMAFRRWALDYGNAYSNVLNNIENKKVFLLVRNGDNIHAVYSSCPSHEASPRLFPTTGDLGQPFRGIDGSRISIRDIEFTKATKNFDDVALHYKRFLILLCGLDHRLGLLGRFYPEDQQLQFMSGRFQAAYFNFLADEEEGTLLGEQLPTRAEWMLANNKLIQSGSRVFVLNGEGLAKQTPEVERRHDLEFDDDQFMRPAIVQREGTRFFITLTATSSSRHAARRSQSCKSYLTDDKGQGHAANWWLCIDGVALETVRRYIHSRVNRAMGVEYLRLMRRLEAYLAAEEEAQAPATDYLVRTAAEFGGVSLTEARSVVGNAVRNWRASRRGAPLPSVDDKAALNAILSLMTPTEATANSQEALLDGFVASQGLTPLLLTQSGKGKLQLYVVASDADKAPYPDLLKWGWVRRIVLNIGKTKISAGASTLQWLGKDLPGSETELRRWEGLAAWQHDEFEPISPKQYARLPGLLEGALEWLDVLKAGPGSGVPADLFERIVARSHAILRKDKRTSFTFACLAIPLSAHTSNGRDIEATYAIELADRVLYTYGNQEQRDYLAQTFPSAFGAVKYGLEVLKTPFAWRLVVVKGNDFEAHDAPFKSDELPREKTPSWGEHAISKNAKRKDYKYLVGKKGAPLKVDAKSVLCWDRAFGQLSGVSPAFLKRAFHAAQQREAKQHRSWTWPKRLEDETSEEMTARLKREATAMAEKPYLHQFTASLSPLIWPAGAGRARANALFFAPLLSAKRRAGKA
ncbi:hypothetical protein ABIC83_002477 [Roseateles asaccharophilus]|uniref:hypothetical protein n=1 Tax=Roseateles asaccharophilus TaxID=582607 RepID=UPI003836C534